MNNIIDKKELSKTIRKLVDKKNFINKNMFKFRISS